MTKETLDREEQPLPKAKLRVVAIGDTFVERYLWPGTPSLNEPGVPETPYVWPDELRARAFSQTFIEISGTPLHSEIYQAFLTECGYASPDFVSVESVPSREDIGEALQASAYPGLATLWSEDKWQEARQLLSTFFQSASFPLDGSRSPFPVYLHELRPYPVGDRPLKDLSSKNDQHVWRISESHGEVRDTRGGDNSISDAIKVVHGRILNWMLKKIPQIDSPTVFVVCDRHARKGELNQSIRDVLAPAFVDKLRETTIDKQKLIGMNSLVLWHTRNPFHHGNLIGEYFSSSLHRQKRVIPIVNAQCLREAGVPLRFDVAFETTICQVLDARSHDAIKFLINFPHSLIRFDYGVIHLSAENGKLSGIDIHALNSGPYARSPSRLGMMAGMTPLLICTILRELAWFVERWEKGLSDRKENTGKTALDGFMDACKEFTHPTIQHSSPLDRAIDLGLLLGQLHYVRGYGDSKDLPFAGFKAGDSSVGQYKKLANDLCGGAINVRRHEELEWAKSSKGKAESERVLKRSSLLSDDVVMSIAFDADKAMFLREVGRLTRISMPKKCFVGMAVNTAKATKQFSRGVLFKNADFMTNVADVSFRDYRGYLNQHLPESIDQILMRVVTHGLDFVLERKTWPCDNARCLLEPSVAVPFVTFGKYRTVHAGEIDAFLEVRHLAEKYIAQKEWTTPLAIAVFGRPGSGKSSIVREILSTVQGCRLDRPLETNVAQWTDLRSLTRQLHRVRDFTLEEQYDAKVPVAFFDEFDSPYDGTDVGWLKYFLMPLQDGLYMDTDDKFHVGKSIFVFAGGVTHTYAEFKTKFGTNTKDKVPDFIGRLRAHINVAGLNLREKGKVDELSVKIRRAVFLRSILLRSMKHIFDHNEVANIAPNIVMAILNAPRFEHGVRSMEAIVQMSRVPSGAHSYQPSALPPLTQLEPHIDAKDFIKYFTG